MKLAIAITLLAAPALAQTTSTPKPVVHHTTTATHRPVAPACADTAGLSPKIPATPGCPKTLYALKYLDLVVGTGPLAEPKKFYTVHYTGWLTDGTKFDSSVDRNEPITFPYGAHRVILGWDTGFEGMHVGGKRRLFIPFQLAYGASAHGPIPPRSELVFDVELLSQSDTKPEPKTPPAPPKPAPSATTPPASMTPSTNPATPSTNPAAPAPKPATPPPAQTTTPPQTTPKQ